MEKNANVHATLSIIKNNESLKYILEGLSSQPIEYICKIKIDDLLELIQRCINYKPVAADMQKLGIPINYFTDQNNPTENKIMIWISSIGSFIYKNLIPIEISSVLENSEIKYLSLNLDDALVGIPWELMKDDENFLCQKYTISRKILFNKLEDADSDSERTVRFLLISDPLSSLPESENEINYLTNSLLNLPNVKVQRQGPQMMKNEFLNLLSNKDFDIVHFSGHGEFDENNPENSHLKFYDDDKPCYAYEITENLSNKPPKLIFANACETSQSNVGLSGLQGLARAFLSGGSSAYIGTLWPIDDDLASMFAEEFYRYIIYNRTIGEALQLARLRSLEKFGWDTTGWIAYVHYGDPTIKFF